jgi:hypothetical protein
MLFEESANDGLAVFDQGAVKPEWLSVPDDSPEFGRGDLATIKHTSAMQWAIGLLTAGEPIAVDPYELDVDVVGRFTMEAIASQALMCMPHMPFQSANPIEAFHRILLVDFELKPEADILASIVLEPDGHSRTRIEAQVERQDRVTRYFDDPPVPVLVATPISGAATQQYYEMVADFMSGTPLTRLDANSVVEGLLSTLVGELSRAEAFYFLIKLQSLLTGAYKQTFANPNAVIPEAGHGYIE